MQRAKNKKIMTFVVLLLVAFMILSILPIFKAVKANDEKPQNLKIAHVTDTHYLAPEYVNPNNPKYVKYVKTEQKLFTESGAIIEAVFDDIVQDEPDVIVVTGDLTKDGEYESHRGMAKKLETLQAALRSKGLDPKIYVINGNHDINNSLAADFSEKDSVKPARKTSPEEFKEIYKNVTYNDDVELYTNEIKAGAMSYVARPKEGFTVIAVDGCKYTPDATTNKDSEHQTGGKVSQDLLKWIEEKTNEAKKRGDCVFVIQHHSVVPHFTMQPTLAKDFLFDNYKEVGVRYAKAGIKYVLTGHVHSNDIAQLQNTDYGKDFELTDIETGSTATYPCPYRSVVLTNDLKNGNELAQIETRLVKNIDFKDADGKVIDDLQAYAADNNIDEGFLNLMAREYVDKYLDKIKNHPNGLEGFLNDTIGKSQGSENFDLKNFAVEAIKNALPQSEKEAVEKQFATTNNAHMSAKIFYESEKNRIRVKGCTTTFDNELEWFDVSITDESIVKTIDDILTTTEEKIIKDPKAIYKLVDELIPTLLNYEVAEGHTLEEMANKLLQSNQDGTDSRQPQWIDDALNNKEQLVDGLLSTVIDKAYPTLTDDILANYTINAGKIISPSFGRDVNKAIIQEIFALYSKPMSFRNRMQQQSMLRKRLFSNVNSQSIGNVAKMIGDVNVGKTIKLVVKSDKVKTMLPDSLKEKLATLLGDVIYSFGYDTNFAHDNNARILTYKSKEEMQLYRENKKLNDKDEAEQSQTADYQEENSKETTVLYPDFDKKEEDVAEQPIGEDKASLEKEIKQAS
ncbi:MAG: metallophosphoesterase [Clostridia bacterium]|nr:metallophosphoesterase [Clostridia bacterium]